MKIPRTISVAAAALGLTLAAAVPAQARTVGNVVCSSSVSSMIKLQVLSSVNSYISLAPGQCSTIAFGNAQAFRVSSKSCWAESAWGTKYWGTAWYTVNGNYMRLTYRTSCLV